MVDSFSRSQSLLESEIRSLKKQMASARKRLRSEERKRNMHRRGGEDSGSADEAYMSIAAEVDALASKEESVQTKLEAIKGHLELLEELRIVWEAETTGGAHYSLGGKSALEHEVLMLDELWREMVTTAPPVEVARRAFVGAEYRSMADWREMGGLTDFLAESSAELESSLESMDDFHFNSDVRDVAELLAEITKDSARLRLQLNGAYKSLLQRAGERGQEYGELQQDLLADLPEAEETPSIAKALEYSPDELAAVHAVRGSMSTRGFGSAMAGSLPSVHRASSSMMPTSLRLSLS
eukprot:PLAT6021.2.p1 GENE.PLAT6021.2~~PLAT6021.2.p1  ORF type:complete len:342 (+),score=167.53 PLAT6021.2:140-1027(+)